MAGFQHLFPCINHHIFESRHVGPIVRSFSVDMHMGGGWAEAFFIEYSLKHVRDAQSFIPALEMAQVIIVVLAHMAATFSAIL